MALVTEPSIRRPKVLSVEALEKTYGAVKVLNQISLDMEQGEFLVLVGPSGCGKSTLLNCIAGLDEVTGGRILIGDRDVTKVPPRDRDIAMVFQSYALYPTMTVAENIAFGMKVRGLPKREQQKKTEDVAKLLQLDHLLDRKPAHLSGGQRQRVAMGRALVREPVLFLFDEPLSNLDAKLRVEMRGEIKSLHQRLGASIVYVTHDQIEAMTLGTKIVVLNAGAIQQIGTPQDIYRRPANLFVADFMGLPPMNLLSATCRLDGVGARLILGEANQALHDPQPPGGLSRYDGKPVVVGLRPEDIVLGPSTINQVTFEVLGVENAGSDNFVSLKSSGKPITARMPGTLAISVGQAISMNIPPASLCYFDPETQTRIS